MPQSCRSLSLQPSTSQSCFAFLSTRCAVCRAALFVALVVLAETTHADDVLSGETEGRSERRKRDSLPHTSIKSNLPLQLVVIIGSVVLAATLIASLAWIFRSSSNRKGRGEGVWGRRGRRKNSFDPFKPGSIYEFGDGNSIDGLSLKEKSDVSHSQEAKPAYGSTSRVGNGFAAGLSPVSPMPALKGDWAHKSERQPSHLQTIGESIDVPALTEPAPVVQSPVRRGRGWQLFDASAGSMPKDSNNVDVEANGGLPPARRPSFIDRLIAHRSLSHTNMAKIAPGTTLSDPEVRSPPRNEEHTGGGSVRVPERSFTTPAMLLGGGPSSVAQTPGMTGSALLSAIGGAFRRVSQHHQHYTTQARRKFIPSPRQLPIESDYEGTIGANDADLPMARRTQQRQLILCGESVGSPSVRNVLIKTPEVNGFTHGKDQYSSRPFVRSPLAGNEEVAPLHSAKVGTPFQTPGLAGVGTTWLRRMSETTVSLHHVPEQQAQHRSQPTMSLSDQKRQEDFQHSHQHGTGNFAGVGARGARKGALHDWITDSQFAAVPPPDVASRRGSDISFVISERSLPSVSRQNSVRVAKPLQARTKPSTLHKQPSQADLQRVPSLNPRFAATTTLASWLDQPSTQRLTSPSPVKRSLTRSTQEAKESVLDEYYGGHDAILHADDVASNVLLATPLTDYNLSRGAPLWEDVESSRPPSYRTADLKASSHRSGSSSKEKKSKKERRARSTETWTAEHERLEEEKRQVEKAMRRRMRKARRAAKRAAQQATMLESNKAVSRLPAVQAVLVENGYTTTNTSDISKAREQHAERQNILADDGSSIANVAAWKNAPHDDAPEDDGRADMWVEDLLMHTPQMQAPIFDKTKKVKGSSKRVKGRYASMSTKSRKAPSHGVRYAHAAARLNVSRPLSPPESPLTSASEQPSTPPVGHRRASVPTSSSHAPTRSFLVESRRGSKESQATTLTAVSTSCAHKAKEKRHSAVRHVSMPAVNGVDDVQNGGRRRLPLPPNPAPGHLRLTSAYEQVVTIV